MDYFDLHCDTPYECFVKNKDFYNSELAVSGNKGKAFEKWSQVFAVWIKDDMENPFSFYKEIIKDFKEKLNNKPENLIPYFAVEGGALIENDIDRLFTLKTDGIRLLTLTWNGENNIAGGNKSDKDLTDFGREVIRGLNSLNMGSDLSHLNDKSFYKAVEISDYPIATHSNCRGLCNNKRNLSDEQIRLIAEKNGVIGLCFYPEFLNGDVFEGIYQNICHLLYLGFENNIAVGSDFDGAKMSSRLDNIEKVPLLYDYLKQKGIDKGLLDKIFYKNAEKYLFRLEKKPQI